MGARDLLRLVWSNLRRMKARVAMTAIGVIIGTAAVVVLVSLGAGLQKQATESLFTMGGLDELMVRSMGYWGPPIEEKPGGGRQPERPPTLNAEMLEEIRAMEGVIAVMPLYDVYMQGPLRLDRQDGWAQMYGVDMDAFASIVTLDRGGLELYRGQVVIGAMVPGNFIPWEKRWEAEQAGLELPQPPELLGKTLQMIKFSYDPVTWMSSETVVARLQVVGVLKRQGYLYDYSIFLPLKEAQRLNQRLSEGQQLPNPDKDGYSQVLVKLSHPNRAPLVEQTLKDRGFYVESAREQLASINRFFAIVQAILGGIGAIALLVAAFGIANTMTMAIYERTREIGLMKAIGATNQDVMSVFLAEAGSIGLLGGAGGVLLALGLNAIINVVGRSLLPDGGGFFGGGPGQQTAASLTAMPLWLPIFAIIFAVLIGVASGVYPAIRAAALSPIRALKYE